VEALGKMRSEESENELDWLLSMGFNVGNGSQNGAEGLS
jgi:hypothetical protein